MKKGQNIDNLIVDFYGLKDINIFDAAANQI